MVGMSRDIKNLMRTWWDGLSLVARFAITATAVLAACMVVLGIWVSSRIEQGVVRNTAITTAFYMDSYVEPLIQALITESVLPESAAMAIDKVLVGTHLGKQVASIKIWSKSGVIVYSNHREQLGKSFPETEGFRRAMAGEVFSEFDSLTDDENEVERKIHRPMLEIYSPMHKVGTNDVIAVAEFYLFAEKLNEDLQSARLLTVFVVAVISSLILGALYKIVKEGSMTISAQRDDLAARVADLSRLLAQNEVLRENLFEARKRVVSTNERVMRRIGADLHDGPAQLLGLVLLRFNEIEPANTEISAEDKQSGYDRLFKVIEDSLEEIRNISYGIAPPQLERVTLSAAIELAALSHEKRTGTVVECLIGEIPDAGSSLLKTCLYRFTQESLSNAFRHAGGLSQRVEANYVDDRIEVRVSDRGQGFSLAEKQNNGGLGLAGLRDRIESLGGKLEIQSVIGSGTCLIATFEVQ